MYSNVCASHVHTYIHTYIRKYVRKYAIDMYTYIHTTMIKHYKFKTEDRDCRK